jgi:hypothetical protein
MKKERKKEKKKEKKKKRKAGSEKEITSSPSENKITCLLSYTVSGTSFSVMANFFTFTGWMMGSVSG